MRRSQGGWIGLIVLLIALAIVAYLAKDALVKYGLLSAGETTVTRGATGGERSRSSAAGAAGHSDAATTAPSPVDALERARGLERTLKKELEKRAPD